MRAKACSTDSGQNPSLWYVHCVTSCDDCGVASDYLVCDAKQPALLIWARDSSDLLLEPTRNVATSCARSIVNTKLTAMQVSPVAPMSDAKD